MTNTEKDREGAELARQIRERFPDPGWLDEIPPTDDPVGDPDGDYIRLHFTGKRWRDITGKQLAWSGQDPASFSDEGLAYFLPAFLVCFLEHCDQGVENVLSIQFEYWIRRLSPFRRFGYSREQVQLVLKVWNYEVSCWCEDLQSTVEAERERALLERELADWPTDPSDESR